MEPQNITANDKKLFHIQLLGGFYMKDNNGHPVIFRTRKLCSLMAYLSFYSDIPHNREFLMELFWPSDRINSSKLSFRVNLTWLRNILTLKTSDISEILWADRDNIMMKSEYLEIDTLKFKNYLRSSWSNSISNENYLSQAVSLYKGALLPFMDEDWIGPERQSIEDDYLSAASRLIEHCQATGRLDYALSLAHQALHYDPYQELFHCKLIEIYAKQGRPSAARKKYLEFERIFKENLGISPSIEARKFVSGLISENIHNKTTNNFDIPSIIRYYDEFSHCNIPSFSKRFIGREKEIEEIQEMVLSRNVHFINLWGEPGVGKTRLAIEIGRHVRSAFPGGVWFVSLCDVHDPEQIAPTILRNIRIPESIRRILTNSRNAMEVVSELLSHISMVLIIDNLDNISSNSQEVINRILPKSDNSVIIILSREVINSDNGLLFHVEPLKFDSNIYDFLIHGESESLSFLKDNIMNNNPKYIFNIQSNKQLNQLSKQLQGLPRALESVASYISNLPIHQLALQVNVKIEELPTQGIIHRSCPVSLSTQLAIEPSFLRLRPSLQALLIKLSIFVNGWNIESSRFICNEPNIEFDLTSLINTSLVKYEIIHGNLWYNINEFIRIYCVNRLKSEDLSEIKQRYIRYYLIISRKFRNISRKNAYNARFLEKEYQNVLQALKMCSHKDEYREMYCRFIFNLSQYWIDGHHREDAMDVLKYAVSQAESGLLPQSMSLKILLICAELSIYQGNATSAMKYVSLITKKYIDRPRHKLALIEINALICCLNSEYETAFDYFMNILKDEHVYKFPKLECATIFNLVQMSISLKKPMNNIMSLLEKCDEFGHIINDLSIIGSSKLLKGRISLKNGRINESIKEFTEALHILNTSKDLYHQTGVRIYLIDAFIARNNYHKAFKEFKIGICIAMEMNDKSLITSFLLRICTILIKLNKHKEANICFNFIESINDRNKQGISYEFNELIQFIRNNMISNSFLSMNIMNRFSSIDEILDLIYEIELDE